MNRLQRTVDDFVAALQFLTRVPIRLRSFDDYSLARAMAFFPVVGTLIGFAAACVHHLCVTHLSLPIAALLTVIFTVVLTGALHEDGLADAADGFGAGGASERILSIMRDSRIGSYGGAALIFSIGGRIVVLASISPAAAFIYLIVAHTLCRWTSLALAYFMPAASEERGQGAQVAGKVTRTAFWTGTVFATLLTIFLLHWRAVAVLAVAALFTGASALFYRRRLGGVTGDCLGATNQLTDFSILLCGAWTR